MGEGIGGRSDARMGWIWWITGLGGLGPHQIWVDIIGLTGIRWGN